MSRYYTTAQGTATAYRPSDVTDGPWNLTAWTADDTDRESVVQVEGIFKDEAGFRNRQWRITKVDGEPVQAMNGVDQFASLKDVAEVAIAVAARKAEVRGIKAATLVMDPNEPDEFPPDPTDAAGRPVYIHDDNVEDEEAPAVLNPDGTPTDYTVEMLTGKKADPTEGPRLRRARRAAAAEEAEASGTRSCSGLPKYGVAAHEAPVSDFSKDRKAPDQISRTCKACNAEWRRRRTA